MTNPDVTPGAPATDLLINNPAQRAEKRGPLADAQTFEAVIHAQELDQYDPLCFDLTPLTDTPEMRKQVLKARFGSLLESLDMFAKELHKYGQPFHEEDFPIQLVDYFLRNDIQPHTIVPIARYWKDILALTNNFREYISNEQIPLACEDELNAMVHWEPGGTELLVLTSATFSSRFSRCQQGFIETQHYSPDGIEKQARIKVITDERNLSNQVCTKLTDILVNPLSQPHEPVSNTCVICTYP